MIQIGVGARHEIVVLGMQNEEGIAVFAEFGTVIKILCHGSVEFLAGHSDFRWIDMEEWQLSGMGDPALKNQPGDLWVPGCKLDREKRADGAAIDNQISGVTADSIANRHHVLQHRTQTGTARRLCVAAIFREKDIYPEMKEGLSIIREIVRDDLPVPVEVDKGHGTAMAVFAIAGEANPFRSGFYPGRGGETAASGKEIPFRHYLMIEYLPCVSLCHAKHLSHVVEDWATAFDTIVSLPQGSPHVQISKKRLSF